jgi:hypothetical protein
MAGLKDYVCLTANGPENSRYPHLPQAQIIEFEAVNRAALAMLPAILRRLLPDGKIQGHEYAARDPTRNDRHPGSFKINLRSGRWGDFATGDKGGDPVSLVAYLEGVSQGEAARLLGRMLGIDTREARHHG